MVNVVWKNICNSFINKKTIALLFKFLKDFFREKSSIAISQVHKGADGILVN